MSAPLRSVLFILGADNTQDEIRSAFDAAGEVNRLSGLEAKVLTPRTPFARWLADVRNVPVVWLKGFFPLVSHPITISKALASEGGNLLVAFGKKPLEMSRLAIKLTDGQVPVQAMEIKALCFAYPPLISPPSPPALPTIVYFGEVTEAGRLDHLIKALAEPCFSQWQLKVAGTGTARSVMPLVRMSKTLGVADRIEWAGDVDNLSRTISASTVAYIADTDSPKVTTARGCGIPVISSPEQLTSLPSTGAYTPYSGIIEEILSKYTM